MTTRRDFLRGGAAAATGIMFCSCGMLRSAHAQTPARQKLPVSVSGKRVKTIDVHAHCVIPEGAKLLGPAPPSPVRGAEEAVIDTATRLAAMDAQAVDIDGAWHRPDRVPRLLGGALGGTVEQGFHGRAGQPQA